MFLRAGQMAELDACRAEVLGRSACVIQKKARTYICQKQYNLLRFSALDLQRVARGINYVNITINYVYSYLLCFNDFDYIFTYLMNVMQDNLHAIGINA